ncbi:MAG: hypothetical protein ACI82A_002113 [Candidatus Azotimanducaceae bacterium]|jgi:uncharacterized protein (TIGR00255 family)
MTNSMTAFARAESGGIVWELRSVNQRYLDVSFKIPESIRFLEPALRDVLRSKIQRGKVECLLRIDRKIDDPTDLKINQGAVLKLLSATQDLAAMFPNARQPTTLDLLSWPGVLEQEEQDRDALGLEITTAFSEAVKALAEMREREGTGLEHIIRTKLLELAAIVTSVRGEVAVIQDRQQHKIRDRINELKVDVDAGRLEQELVYQAQKSDVAEELDRLNTHVTEVQSTLDSKKPAGRRLDFLMQELNREANTLSSKAIAANTTIAAVELKVIIEQMREQVQNIE